MHIFLFVLSLCFGPKLFSLKTNFKRCLFAPKTTLFAYINIEEGGEEKEDRCRKRKTRSEGRGVLGRRIIRKKLTMLPRVAAYTLQY